MGYCISEDDFPGGLPDGEVEAEARRESFRMYGERQEYLELLYTDIPRLEALLGYIKEHYTEPPPR